MCDKVILENGEQIICGRNNINLDDVNFDDSC